MTKNCNDNFVTLLSPHLLTYGIIPFKINCFKNCKNNVRLSFTKNFFSDEVKEKHSFQSWNSTFSKLYTLPNYLIKMTVKPKKILVKLVQSSWNMKLKIWHLKALEWMLIKQIWTIDTYRHGIELKNIGQIWSQISRHGIIVY